MVVWCCLQLFFFELELLLLYQQLSHSITLSEHLALQLILLVVLLLEILLELLVLEHRVSVRGDPRPDKIKVNALGLMLLGLKVVSPLLLFQSSLL